MSFQSKSEEPLYRCSTNIKHTDPVWSIKWQYEQTEGKGIWKTYLNHRFDFLCHYKNPKPKDHLKFHLFQFQVMGLLRDGE